MASAAVLLVDDDPSVHQLVRSILKRGGYDLRIAPNGMEALKMAKESPPDLIVTDVLMPFMDGWTLVKKLRSSPQLAFIPVIFLTSQAQTEDYIRGFRLGADDYVDKTSSFWDLSDRVAKSLARRRELEATIATAVSDQAPAGLQGRFDQIGLGPLLTVLELGQRGGIMRVRRTDPAEEGLLYLVKGRIYRANVQGRKDVRNREAVYAMLGWSQGTYEFTAERLRVADEVDMATTQMLLEGARRIDERRPRA